LSLSDVVGSVVCTATLNAVVQISQSMVKVMEVDNEENPLRILTFAANDNFHRALLTICLTFLGIAIRLVFGI